MANRHAGRSIFASITRAVHYRLPQVTLRPKALFEIVPLGNNGTIHPLVIVACEQGSLPKTITPATIAPPEYNTKISCFLDTGTVPPPRKTQDEEAASGKNILRVEASALNSESQWTQNWQQSGGIPPEEHADAWDPWRRRGGVIPGTRAARRPCDPPTERPFQIAVDSESGTIAMELVMYVHGGPKCSFDLGLKRRNIAGVFDGDSEVMEVTTIGNWTLDGAHGAPLFVGGTLFAFAVQVSTGERTWYDRCNVQCRAKTDFLTVSCRVLVYPVCRELLRFLYVYS